MSRWAVNGGMGSGRVQGTGEAHLRVLQAAVAVVEALEQRQLLSSGALEVFSASAPAVFVENQGQWSDRSVRYAYQSAGAGIAFTDLGVMFQLVGSGAADGSDANAQATESTRFSASFVGAQIVRPVGLQQSSTRFNYYLGEASGHRSNVAGYQQMLYSGLYDGVDLYAFGQRANLKYEFHVAPGSDYRQVQIRYDGIQGLSIAADGSLHIRTAPGEMVDDAPVIYQEINGQRVEVAGRFVLLDANTYAFEVTGEWDGRYELVLDPTLEWSSYMGGGNTDKAYGVATGTDGSVWVTGEAASFGWASGGFDSSLNGSSDGFVAKVNPNGTLAWAAYLGGSPDGTGFGGTDAGYAIALDAAGNAWVTGYTMSAGWTTGGFDTTHNSGDAFVAKIGANGTLAWSSYLGGTSMDIGNDISVDANGNAWVVGETYSSGWLTGGANGTYGAFLAKISAAGTLTSASYLPAGRDVATDLNGNVWVTGSIASSSWITGGFDTSYNGGPADAFVAKFSGSGTLLWSSYVGGSLEDYAGDIAVDAGGNVWITGWTSSSGWTAGGFDTSFNSDHNAFVVKINANGTPAWSSYLGGGNWGYAISTDAGGNAWVTGVTDGTDWAGGGFDTSHNGGSDAFVAQVSADGGLLWSSYLGGNETDEGQGIVVDADGNGWVVGASNSAGWAAGGFDTICDYANSDGFVAKVRPRTVLGFAGSSMTENQPAGTVVGTFSATGYDGGFGLTYSLTPGSGSTDNALFTIVGDQLRIRTPLDYETKHVYSICVRITDGHGFVSEGQFSISVTDINEAPTGLGLSSRNVAENAPSGTVVGTFSAMDQDAGNTFTYAFVDGTGSGDNSSFAIVGNQLRTAAVFDYEARSSYSIRVRTTDQDGLWYEGKYTMYVTDVNDRAPIQITGTDGADQIGVAVDGSRYAVSVNGSVSYYWIGHVATLTINTLAGDDTVTVGAGAQACTIDGGLGNDSITGGEGNDSIRGDAGNDTISGGAGDDSLMGNTGDDSLSGGDGADQIQAGLGYDFLAGGLGNDGLYAGDQMDTVYGDEGDDYIEGRGKADTIYGGAGNDTILGGAGSDSILAEDGDDRIWVGISSVFADTVDGGAGNDSSDGDANDVLSDVESVLA